MQYKENNITFHDVKDVLQRDSTRDSGSVLAYRVGKSQYDSADQIIDNIDWDSQFLINCVDIHWGEAELYGNSRITNTLQFLDKIRLLYNVFSDTPYELSIIYYPENIGSEFTGMIAQSSYSNQEDIEGNLDFDSQYVINCIDIIWDKAGIRNHVLNTSADLLSMISGFIKDIETLSK